MDEFADLEKELSGNGFRRGFHQLEDFVFEIEERRSQSNTIFWREEIDLSPIIKRNRLILGGLLTPLMGLGLLLIWSVLRLGSIDEQTSIIRGRGYHMKLHSIVKYEIQNGQVHSAKANKITHSASIQKSKIYYGSSGDWRWDFEIINGKRNKINLLSIDDEDDDSRDHIIPDFAKRMNLEIKEYFPSSLGNSLKELFILLTILFVTFAIFLVVS